MTHTRIKDLLNSTDFGKEFIAKGWIRTFRNNQFLAINDGSCLGNLQVVIGINVFDEKTIKKVHTGASVGVKGVLIESQGKGQRVELQASELEVSAENDADKHVLQPKKHSLDFLREIAHLRFRTNTFNAIFKVRNALAFAVHQFFNERGFVYIHTPIITGSDAEGAGEMFQVTN